VKRAIEWISDRLREQPDAKRVLLIDEASRRFDLSPRDEEFLYEFYRDRRAEPEAG
jgi:hypothetical protein